MPEWLKTTTTVMIVMILWDCIRLFLQAYVTKWVLKSDFDEIDQALDEVQEEIEEEDNEQSIQTKKDV